MAADLECSLRDADKVIVQDESGKVGESGKWPLVIDPSGRVGTFLRYRDVNYLCVANPGDMKEERIRMAVLGALRYGKPVVVDMLDTDLVQAATEFFNRVQPNLMESILNKEILDEKKYSTLVKSADGEDYMQGFLPEQFSMIFLTAMDAPPTALATRTFCIRIV